MGPSVSQRVAPRAAMPMTAVSTRSAMAMPHTIHSIGPRQIEHGRNFHSTAAAATPSATNSSWSVR